VCRLKRPTDQLAPPAPALRRGFFHSSRALFKSRRRLEVENLFLRHQLNIALRRAPHRLRLRGHEVASRSPHILTEATAARRRRTDQSLAPSFLADEGARPALRGTSVVHLASLDPPTTASPAAVNVAPGLANMHARGRRHSDRRTASIPAMAAAAAKNIAKKSASYAHANPRLKQETSAIIVSSRTLASNSCPPLCRRSKP
jgi:hypothetical protein